MTMNSCLVRRHNDIQRDEFVMLVAMVDCCWKKCYHLFSHNKIKSLRQEIGGKNNNNKRATQKGRRVKKKKVV